MRFFWKNGPICLYAAGPHTSVFFWKEVAVWPYWRRGCPIIWWVVPPVLQGCGVRQTGAGVGSQLSSLFCKKSYRFQLSIIKGRLSRVELCCSSCIPPPSLCHPPSAAWALAQVTGSAQAQSSTAQLFHWNGLLNPAAKCVPCSSTRGFNNLDCPPLLAVSLGSSCVPLLHWALSLTLPLAESFLLLDPCPGSYRGQDSQALPLACLDSAPVHSSASSAASSGLGCIWPLVLVSVPDGARMGWKRPTGKLGSSKSKPPSQGPEHLCSAGLHRISLSNLWLVPLMLTAAFWHFGRASDQTDWASPLFVTGRIHACILQWNRDSYCPVSYKMQSNSRR